MTLKLLKVTSNTIIRLLHVKYKTTHRGDKNCDSSTSALLYKLLQDYRYQ